MTTGIGNLIFVLGIVMMLAGIGLLLVDRSRPTNSSDG